MEDGHEPTPLEQEMDARARGEKMPNEIDPVDDDELDGDLEDRDDADIDNDGEVDDEDEYLHNRRQAIDKAVEEAFDNQLTEGIWDEFFGKGLGRPSNKSEKPKAFPEIPKTRGVNVADSSARRVYREVKDMGWYQEGREPTQKEKARMDLMLDKFTELAKGQNDISTLTALSSFKIPYVSTEAKARLKDVVKSSREAA